MKKLMKKKMSFLGKEFTVFALVTVCMMTFASAALVGYLSNDVSGDFSTDSPLTLEISGNGLDWEPANGESGMSPIALGDIFGGETATFYLKGTNNAEASFSSNLLIELVSDYDDGKKAECTDFTNMAITGTIDGGTTTTTYDSSPACSNVDGLIVLTIPTSYADSEVETYTIALTADVAIAPSTYTVTAQQMA